jgi:hypothetical protein
MPNKRAKAEALVAASTRSGTVLSADTREGIVAALTEDLRAKSARRRASTNQATSVEERLAKIENRMRVLAEAVLAIAEMSHASGPEVQAVKEKL